MGYIKKVYRDMLMNIDCMGYLPAKWNEFVKKQEEHQNLIIRKGKESICTNCKHIFKGKKRVNEKEKCPNCKNTYTVKKSNLKNYIFTDDLAFLDKVDDFYVLRIFELASSYDNISRYHGFNRSIVEYARILLNADKETFVNERVSKCQGHIHVNHWQFGRKMEITYKILQCCKRRNCFS